MRLLTGGKYGQTSIVRSAGSKTRKRGGRGELSTRRPADRPGRAGHDRLVRNSAWADNLRDLRRLSGRSGTASSPLRTSRGSTNGKSPRASCETARHREGRCPCSKASKVNTSLTVAELFSLG